jgi:demethylmenaquinone methyltransferase/2-methoxy-6-polyprenyl-1,4-benzoquinol methylase
MPLRSAFASPDAKRRYNRRLFHVIADRYDLITVLLSYGRDRRWKERVAEAAAVREGECAVDLACGTGDLAFLVADRGARVVGVDLTPRMLQLARRRDTSGRLRLVAGDMTSLPLADGCADVVTSGYGLRNVPVLEDAVREVFRILRPGGRFIALDFNRPANPVVRAAYFAYLAAVGSALGLALHGDPDTYRYIPASLRRYPGAAAVTTLLRQAGFAEAGWMPLLGGLMAMNVGRKGGQPQNAVR